MSIRYFQSLPRASAESLSGKVLAQVRKEFGAEVEPFTLHLPVPELLAGVWMACRETLLAGSGRRDAREVVAASVSALNRCPFCVDAHSIMLLESSGNDYSDLMTSRKTELIDDLFLRETAAWASATRTPGSPLLQKPPFSPEEAPAFIGTAVLFHYINRMVTILLGPSPLPFTSGLPKKVSMQMAAWFFSNAIHRPKEPGASLDLLAEAPLPNELSWAKPSKPIAGAFARFAQAVERSGELALSPDVRSAVGKAVANWNGSDPGMDNGWCEEVISPLGVTDKSAGRLALLAALAPYRVDESTVHAFSASLPGDASLLSALAWSSFTAAKKIGSWI
jgi:AhpD family alkylhydroperoxidase